IKAVQPHGPYRLGGFCGSSLLVFILAEEFQGNGDVVSHALLIDHFPLLYASPIWQLDCETATACCVSPQLRKRGFDWIMSLYANETNPSEKRVGEELMKAGESPSSVRPHMMKQYENTMTFIGAQALFISETFVDSADTFDGKKVLDRFVQWLSENFKFPVTLFLAAVGMKNLFLAKEQAMWGNLGAEASRMYMTVEVVDAGHFDILSSEGLIAGLQKTVEQRQSNGHANGAPKLNGHTS
ncbi:Mycolipanoate synthase, partial [Marasmius sp. AFHP31]